MFPQRPLETVRPDPLGKLANGEYVWEKIDGSHLDQHADVRPLVGEALRQIRVSKDQDRFGTTVDLGRILGTQSCVTTGEGDEIVYMMRIKDDGSPARAGFIRFVLNREPEPSSCVTVLAERDEETRTWILLTAWVGQLAEKEPWDETCDDEEYTAACQFWANHALCDDGTNPVNRKLVTADPNAVGYFNRRLPLAEDG